MIKAIIFDLDDTLIQTSKAKYKALQHAAKKFYNLEITDQDIQSHWGKPFELFMRDLFGDIEETAKIIQNYYTVRNNFPTPAYEESKQTLLEFRDKYKLGVVTASTRHMTLEDLRIAGLSELMFDLIQTCEETSFHKPNPKVFDPIKNTFLQENIMPNELLYVGDSLSDWEAAKGAEINFIGIADRTTPKVKFTELGVESVLKLDELKMILDKMV